MTVEVSGIASAQARIQELQNRFGALAAPSSTSTGATGSTATSAGGASSAGSFGASMAKATAIARANAARASAAAPFVWNPTTPPGSLTWKDGGRQAIAAPSGPAATAGASGAVGSSGTSGASGASGASGSTAVSGVSDVAPVDGVAGTSRVDRLIATAKQYLGVPYKWGGTNPAVGLDCSGFTQLVYRQNGISLPRVAQDQQDVGTRVASLADAKPGDLLFFGDPATHVTMYLGDNKMIHAPRTGRDVSIDTVYRTPTTIRRYLPEGSDVPTVSRGGTSGRTVGADLPSATEVAAAQNSVRSARLAAASAVLSAGSGSDVGSALGGWAGATPAPDTWGAAVAAAAVSGIDGITSGAPLATPVVATPAVSSAGSTSSAAPAVAGSGPLSQAPASLQPLFVAAARKYGVSADLLAAVAKQESGFKATAVSHAGARGLMQLMPGTARGLGVRNSFDPEQAIDGAARLLRDHLRTFGSTSLALAAYNAGPGAVRRYDGVPPYAETQNYVRRIMANLSSVGNPV